jgi:chitin synthase
MSTYINILMVYAFNNWHDVSWGTKGSDKAEALPSAHVTKGEKDEVVVEEVEKEQEDIDSQFEQTVRRALAPFKEEEEVEKADVEDGYKSFRTGLVVCWLFGNILLIVCITSDKFDNLGWGVSFPFFLTFATDTNILIGTCHSTKGALLPVPSVRYCRALACSFCRFLVVPGQDWYHVLFLETISAVRICARCIRHSHLFWRGQVQKSIGACHIRQTGFLYRIPYVTYAGF